MQSESARAAMRAERSIPRGVRIERDWHTLSLLGPATRVELAEAVGISEGVAASRLRKLVKKGWATDELAGGRRIYTARKMKEGSIRWKTKEEVARTLARDEADRARGRSLPEAPRRSPIIRLSKRR